eukprot:1384168-Amorphochlora_amoeboformis.AAC.1
MKTYVEIQVLPQVHFSDESVETLLREREALEKKVQELSTVSTSLRKEYESKLRALTDAAETDTGTGNLDSSRSEVERLEKEKSLLEGKLQELSRLSKAEQ